MRGALPPPLAQGEPWTQTYRSSGLYSTAANSSLIAFPLVNAGPLQLQLPCESCAASITCPTTFMCSLDTINAGV